MTRHESRAINRLISAIHDHPLPLMVKAGPSLWNTLKTSGRAAPCGERICMLQLDGKINVILDGFQEAWEFMLVPMTR